MSAPEFKSLAEAGRWYAAWLGETALPLWADRGVDARTGAFREALTADGEVVLAPLRARVQARQAFVFATVSQAGFGARWREVAERGFAFFDRSYRRADHLYAILADENGRVLNPTPCLYEQDFALLALSALASGGEGWGGYRDAAERTLGGLQAHRHAAGGFRESGLQPFQANAHMHLLEAALAWDELGAGPSWTALADEVVALCLARFIDPERGFLREFFTPDWAPAAGDDGRLVEPGHQFEWAWLLKRWGEARREPAALEAAATLYEIALLGVDRVRGVAVNGLSDDLSVRDPVARLWPQTEYLKTALAFGDEAEALSAACALARYLDTPALGVWRDKMEANGAFRDEPAPATSLYHLTLAILELMRHAA